MNWIEAIKGERRMSLNHWRYRLLHWCFGVESRHDSNIPDFMYTHYCPLFHVTNLIALLSPVILLARILGFLIKNIIVGIALVVVPLCKTGSNLIMGLLTALTERLPKRKEQEPQDPPPPSPRQLRMMDLSFINKMILTDEYWCDFGIFWDKYSYRINSFDQEEARRVHQQIVQAIADERKRKAEKEARMRARMVALANFSRAFVKVALYFFYATLAVALVAAVYYWTIPVASFIAWAAITCWTFMQDSWIAFVEWMSTINWTLVGIWTLAIGTGVALLFLLSLAGIKLRLGTKSVAAFDAFVDWASPPFKFLGWLIAWPFVAIGKCCKAFGEFISVFYEENCPPITIVDDEA